MTVQQPAVSVIIPLVRHMGHALESVAGWTGQDYPREKYELLVMSNGSNRDLDRSVQGLLGPADRLIHHPSVIERELYDVGAWKADGQLLIFTESHCVADADFLEEMTKFLAQGDYAGACGHTQGEFTNSIGRVLCKSFDDDFRLWGQPNDRRKVIIHGFAILRKAYFEVGAYESPFGNFQDALLAAKLEQHGYRLGYARRARVHHHYASSLKDSVDQYRSYAEGECTYRLDHAEEFCDEQFGVSPEWQSFLQYQPADRQRILGVLARHLLHRGVWRLDVPLIRATVRALWAGVPNLSGLPILAAAWSLRVALLRCHAWRFQPVLMQRAFRDISARTVRLTRLKFLAHHATEVRRRLRPSQPGNGVAHCTEGHRPMAEIPPRCLVGFHDLESRGAHRFRWSRPIAGVRLAIPPGVYQVELETRGFRQTRRAGLRAFFNERVVPKASITLTDDRITFPIYPRDFAADPEQLLILTCNPVPRWRTRKDRRVLGLPVVSLTITPASRSALDAEPFSHRGTDF